MGIGAVEYQEIVMMQGNEAVREYSSWVANFHWDWYGHFTFSYEIPSFKKKWEISKWVDEEINKISIEYARKMFKRWRRILCQEIWGKHFERKGFGLSYVVGIENEESNIHLHALIGNNFGIDLNKMVCRMCAKILWEGVGLRTGMARLENFDYTRFKKEQTAFYLAKHQIKQNNIFDFFVFPRGLRLTYVNNENWLYDEKEKNYIKIDEFYKFIGNYLQRHPLVEVLRGCHYVWQMDWVSRVFCAGICKQYSEHRLRFKGDGVTGDGETCFSGEQGEQNSLFPQNPEPPEPF